jgi:hypothetical protein
MQPQTCTRTKPREDALTLSRNGQMGQFARVTGRSVAVLAHLAHFLEHAPWLREELSLCIPVIGTICRAAARQASGLVEPPPPSCASRLRAVVRPHRTKTICVPQDKPCKSASNASAASETRSFDGWRRTQRTVWTQECIPSLKACSEKLCCWPQADLGQNRARVTPAILKGCSGSSAGLLEQRI